ncbi:hypothetical protein [Parabacteroides pacaensis]|uniref:hypothetical protein n=1 Tax=Parabacteroides pacaensis TaxID=2086575 RepID=UPI000D0FCE7F|nr:hypothetical protein [Parabacteroides pacaensis]
MKKKLTCLVITLSCVLSALLVFSCSKETDSWNNLDQVSLGSTKYLDIDIPENGELSETQLKVFEEAFLRVDKYLVVDEDTCYLTTHSAAKMHMSDKLFSLITQSVDNKNAQYRTYLYFKEHSDLGIKVQNPFEIQPLIPMTKAQTEFTNNGYSTTSTIKLSHSEVTTVLNAMRDANGSVGFFSSIIASAIGGTAAGILVGMYTYLNDSQFSRIQNEYATSGYTNGITLTEITTRSPTTGISFTTYSSSINK